ncbi:MAG: hypothetical protein ACR2NZ_15505 [Rubripirellula sp.]
MNSFQECASAIRHRGMSESADLIDQLATLKPKLFAAVSIEESAHGDEVHGFDPDGARLFLTRKSARIEVSRKTCDYLRRVPLSELLEKLEMEDRQVDADHLSAEMSRILGRKEVFPDSNVEYWNDPRCERPLLAADTSDESTAEIAGLLRLKLFKVVSVQCDLAFEAPERVASAGEAETLAPTSEATGQSGVRGFLARLTGRDRSR